MLIWRESTRSFDSQALTRKLWLASFNSQTLTRKLLLASFDSQALTCKLWLANFDSQALTRKLWLANFDSQIWLTNFDSRMSTPHELSAIVLRIYSYSKIRHLSRLCAVWQCDVDFDALGILTRNRTVGELKRLPLGYRATSPVCIELIGLMMQLTLVIEFERSSTRRLHTTGPL